MGWYFNDVGTRKDLINDLTQGRQHVREDGVVVISICHKHCFRGNIFSGVLWTVWERTYILDGAETQTSERWIGCDLINCVKSKWGYKPLCEVDFPYYFSCPLGYLELVPLGRYSGNANWRKDVRKHHAERAAKRNAKRLLTA